MILIIFIATRENNRLGPMFGLPGNPRNHRKMNPPLPTFYPAVISLPNQHPRLLLRVVFGRNGSKMVRRDGHEDSAARGVGLAGLLGSLCGERLVRPVLVLDLDILNHLSSLFLSDEAV